MARSYRAETPEFAPPACRNAVLSAQIRPGDAPETPQGRPKERPKELYAIAAALVKGLRMTTATLSPLAATALVAAGGAAGSALRYQVGAAIAHIGGISKGFPWAILSVNILGSLAMGILFGWLASRSGGSESMRLLLGVGLLGGFTTFSAFSLDLMLLIQRGALGLACVYALASVIAGVIALYLGLILMGEAQ